MDGTSLQQSKQPVKASAPNDLLNIFREEFIAKDIPIRENSDSIPLAWRVMPPQFFRQQSFPKDDHFDFEDMQEVARFRKPGSLQTVNNYERETEIVIRALPEELRQSIINNPLHKSRLQSLIALYLKDIRDDIETGERLMASYQAGGMAFEPDLVARVLEIIKKEKSNQNLPPAPSIPKIQSIDIAKIQSLKSQADNQQRDKPKIPQPPVVAEIPVPTANFSIPISTVLKKDSLRVNERPGGKAVNRVRISDIAPRAAGQPPSAAANSPEQTRLTKPSLEFCTLDTEDLRREASPDNFIEKIVARIQTLTESDYRNRSEAISAWKLSPLYAKYLKIGAKSLAQGKEVREYIAQNEGAELSYQEFEAIGKLNQKLRF